MNERKENAPLQSNQKHTNSSTVCQTMVYKKEEFD